MFSLFVKVYAEWRKEQRAAKIAARKYKVASGFNGLYYASHHGLWMCPDCNTVHKTTGFSAFTGQLFPACCRFEDGHRCFWKEHATDESLGRAP